MISGAIVGRSAENDEHSDRDRDRDNDGHSQWDIRRVDETILECDRDVHRENKRHRTNKNFDKGFD